MIALTTFIIYNTLFTIGMVDTARPNNYGNYKSVLSKTEASLPDIFMHVFAHNGDEDYNMYLPYIKKLANKHKEFTFNVIIITNDTVEEGMNNYLDETNNNNALNSLWSSNINYDNTASLKGNINVMHAYLSTYLDCSPLKKNWKELPEDLIPFLVRAVSVWQKGGIAINPIILTPQSPSSAYMEKLTKIIKNLRLTQKVTIPEPKTTPAKRLKITPRFNNIRDIIDDLDHKNSDDDPIEEVLRAEESIINLAADTELIPFRQYDITTEKQTKLNPKHILAKIGSTESKNYKLSTTSKRKDDGKEGLTKLLPLFLEYLFHNKRNNLNNATQSIEKRSTTRTTKTETHKNKDSDELYRTNFRSDIKLLDDYKPMIISTEGIQNPPKTPSTTTKTTYQDDKIFDLTVDLKGNLIATGTPCHAFIGNVFLDALHHSEKDTLTDFIIMELSIFCKGLFTSCLGIDVILV